MAQVQFSLWGALVDHIESAFFSDLWVNQISEIIYILHDPEIVLIRFLSKQSSVWLNFVQRARFLNNFGLEWRQILVFILVLVWFLKVRKVINDGLSKWLMTSLLQDEFTIFFFNLSKWLFGLWWLIALQDWLINRFDLHIVSTAICAQHFSIDRRIFTLWYLESLVSDIWRRILRDRLFHSIHKLFLLLVCSSHRGNLVNVLLMRSSLVKAFIRCIPEFIHLVLKAFEHHFTGLGALIDLVRPHLDWSVHFGITFTILKNNLIKKSWLWLIGITATMAIISTFLLRAYDVLFDKVFVLLCLLLVKHLKVTVQLLSPTVSLLPCGCIFAT